jgi:hypothetical protein
MTYEQCTHYDADRWWRAASLARGQSFGPRPQGVDPDECTRIERLAERINEVGEDVAWDEYNGVEITPAYLGERLNRLGDQHSDPIVVKHAGHVRFGVSTDDHCVLFEHDDQGEKIAAHWLEAEEARELAEALITAVGWLAEEEAASDAYGAALSARA